MQIFKRTIKNLIKSAPDTRVLTLAEVPNRYRGLVKKIMRCSPVWGAHQTIRFPDGFVLKGGRDETRLEMFNLPKTLDEFTVLDIGCNLGAIAIECKKRNARRVVGIDKEKRLIQCAQYIADILGLDIEYSVLNIIKDKIQDQFDFVFLLNVYHHLDEQDRRRTLRAVDAITKRKLFFEAPTKKDLIADDSKCLSVSNYISHLRNFTTFNVIKLLGRTDFDRPLIACER